MYGSHHYSNSSGTPTTGPPPPEWRLPSNPQRPSWQPGAATPPPPPPPPPPPGYSSNSLYGPPPVSAAASVPPVPDLAGVNTTSWGVNYNRQNYVQAPPPLPPRPPSTTGQPQSIQSPVVSSADSYQPSVGATSYGGQIPSGEYHQQQWTTNLPYISQQTAASLAPPPPPPPPPAPKPPSYQNAATPPPPTPPQAQQTWHQLPPPSYSNVQPSQYQPPTTIPNPANSPPAVHPGPGFSQVIPTPPEGPVSQPPPPASLPVAAPPVPPKASPLIIPTGSSALGFGGPSDWEHLSPIAGNIDDEDIFKPKSNTAPLADVMYQLPPSQPADLPNRVSNNQPPTPPPPGSSFASRIVNTEAQSQSTQSPVSPATAQDFQAPTPPVRVDTTESDYSTLSAIANSESIDGVIEAWNKPISTESKPSTPPDVKPESVSQSGSPSPPEIAPAKQQELPVSEKETQTDTTGSAKGAASEPAGKTETPTPPSRPVDRYEDLDSWSQSSLERYVAMLRKEAVADSDEERFKIFTAFMAKETKLREILYNIEHEDKASTKDERSGMDAAPQQSGAAPKPEANQPEDEDSTPPVESGLIPVESEEGYFATSGERGDAEYESYSPGGRPILPRLHTPQVPLHRSVSNPGGPKYGPGHSIALRSTSVPPIMNEVQRTVLSPLTTNPPQRIYTPFRYTEGPQRGSDKLIFDRPAYQAYSALRQASAESGRLMSDAPTSGSRNRSSSAASVQNGQDETFVGLIREKSVAYRQDHHRKTSSPPPLPAALRQGKPPDPIEALRSIVSSPVNKQSESLWHTTVRKDLEKFSNDFSFAREIFKPWEKVSKTRREALEKERSKRQEESESHIDALFNGKEIGYADINILEEEFRQTEARTQLEEERREVDDFISNVFNQVDKRLEEEISTLQVHYESALGQLDRENGDNEGGADKRSVSHTMKIVIDIHHRLEMRHHKRLEIALDRERRRKKAERRPLVFMGDSAALKKLDNDFDQMEKQNILEAARGRDERANRLMDSFDDAIMHGLGENQSILDELSAKVSRVDEAAIRSSGLPDAEIEQVLKSVYNLVETLRQDSESILHSFGAADSALNNADYSVSVAEARYSNSDLDVLRQLDAEKKKEDAKIQNNLRTKLRSVRVGPAKITATINDALRALGKAPLAEQPIPSDVIPASQLYDVSLPSPSRPASAVRVARKLDDDSERRERLRKALEDAKKRNAARNAAPGGEVAK